MSAVDARAAAVEARRLADVAAEAARQARIQEATEQFHKTVRDIRAAEKLLRELLRAYKVDEPRLAKLESELALLNRHLQQNRAILSAALGVDENDEPVDRAEVQARIAALEAAIAESTPQVLGIRREQAGRVMEISRLQRALTGMELAREQSRTLAAGGTVGTELKGGIYSVI